MDFETYKELHWDDADTDVYEIGSHDVTPEERESWNGEGDPEIMIHKAEPIYEDEHHCKVCGQPIKLVPGGHGSVYVHADSGAVAAPNPPMPQPGAGILPGSKGEWI